MSVIYVCAPAGYTYRAYLWCPKAKRRVRHLVTTYVWYDPDDCCLHCVPDARGWNEAMTRAEAHEAVCAEAMSYTTESAS